MKEYRICMPLSVEEVGEVLVIFTEFRPGLSAGCPLFRRKHEHNILRVIDFYDVVSFLCLN